MQLNSDSFFYNTTYSREKVLALIDKADNPSEFRLYISTNILKSNKKDPKYNAFREEIYLTVISSSFKLGHKLKFSIEKFSTLFSIIDFVFNESLDQKMSALDGYSILKKILSHHLYQCEPYSLGIFNEKEHQEILKFMRDYFFRYFSLYEISLTKFIDYNIFTASPNEEDWPSGKYESLDNGEIIEPALVKDLEVYFLAEELSLDDKEGINEKEAEENDKLKELENQQKIKLPMTDEMRRVEKEIEKSILQAKEEVGKKIDNAEKVIKDQIEEIINPKKKK